MAGGAGSAGTRSRQAEPSVIMGRKLDPTKKEKRGPGRKARKQKGAETELVRFLPAAGDENFKRLSSRARKRAAKRRAGSVDAPKPNKSPGIKTLPGEVSKGAVQARGKKRPAPIQNSDGDEEEDSEEDDVVTQGDLWGSEDSGEEDMVDDYGVDSNSEAEEKVRRCWYSQGDLPASWSHCPAA